MIWFDLASGLDDCYIDGAINTTIASVMMARLRPHNGSFIGHAEGQ